MANSKLSKWKLIPTLDWWRSTRQADTHLTMHKVCVHLHCVIQQDPICGAGAFQGNVQGQHLLIYSCAHLILCIHRVTSEFADSNTCMQVCSMLANRPCRFMACLPWLCSEMDRYWTVVSGRGQSQSQNSGSIWASGKWWKRRSKSPQYDGCHSWQAILPVHCVEWIGA